MLNAIGLANPGIDALPLRPPAAARRARRAALGLGRRLRARRLRRALRERLDDRARGRGDRAEPLLPERRRGAGERRRDRRARPGGDDQAALREALARRRRTSPTTARAAEAAGADGLSLVNTIKGLALDERTLQPVLARGAGGLSGPGAAAGRARGRLRVPPRDEAADRRHGRCRPRTRRARAPRGRRERRRARHVLFADPGAATRIRAELEAELAALGFVDPDNAVALAHKGPRVAVRTASDASLPS